MPRRLFLTVLLFIALIFGGFTFSKAEANYVLQDGDTGVEVVDLKQTLTKLGFGNFPSSPSQVFGSVTAGVVKEFQQYYGLNVTGNVDEETFSEIIKSIYSPYQAGNNGVHIIILKHYLTSLGYGNFPNNPSNAYGSVTAKVVKDFQESQNLIINGIADKVTLERISSLLSNDDILLPFNNGDNSTPIIQLKKDLTKLGFGNFPSNPSSAYGNVTENVVVDFQRYYGLTDHGETDETTLTSLAINLSSPYQSGNSGNYIVELKENLTLLGYGNFPQKPSSVYGSVTTNVVKNFQESQSLVINGIADEVTLAKIDELLTNNELTLPYKDGDSGLPIIQLKNDLTKLGFGNFPSNPSDKYGPVTSGVIADFQEYYGLHTDGITDESTLAKIEEILSSPYRDGQRGPHIVELKENLTLLGFGNFPDSPSQAYGSVTSSIVREFQKSENLVVNGIADEVTLNRINDLLAKYELSIPYEDGDQGPPIIQLKKDLTKLGFGNFPSNPSDKYGPVTSTVVADFQEYYGLHADGITDESTLAKVEEVLSSPYRDGQRGSHIVELKENLTLLGFGNFPDNPSNAYGSVTAGVVKDFQSYYKLTVNGIADEVTLSKIEEILSSPYRDGQRGSHIVELKENLALLGFGNFPDNPSNAYGSVTTGVVKDFQSYYKLTVNGIADEVTLSKIEEILSSPYRDGQRGSHIVELKENLTLLGFGNFPDNPSNAYGSVTAGVVSDFQRNYGLAVSGIAEEVTLSQLNVILSLDTHGFTTANSLNVRSGPSTNYDTVGSLNAGSKVAIIESSGDWLKIVFGNSYAYVHSDYVRNDSDRKTIVIDAGHGGSDPGATAFGWREKDIVLDVALLVEEKMRGTDIDIVLTRSGDYFLELEERVDVAHSAHADAFVSIHANAAGQESVHGTETYWNRNNHSADSQRLATSIQNQLISKLNTRDRGVKEANFYVIRHTEMPSVLVELGFVTNRQEAERMQTSSFKNDAADAIKEGIIEFYR